MPEVERIPQNPEIQVVENRTALQIVERFFINLNDQDLQCLLPNSDIFKNKKLVRDYILKLGRALQNQFDMLDVPLGITRQAVVRLALISVVATLLFQFQDSEVETLPEQLILLIDPDYRIGESHDLIFTTPTPVQNFDDEGEPKPETPLEPSNRNQKINRFFHEHVPNLIHWKLLNLEEITTRQEQYTNRHEIGRYSVSFDLILGAVDDGQGINKPVFLHIDFAEEPFSINQMLLDIQDYQIEPYSGERNFKSRDALEQAIVVYVSQATAGLRKDDARFNPFDDRGSAFADGEGWEHQVEFRFDYPPVQMFENRLNESLGVFLPENDINQFRSYVSLGPAYHMINADNIGDLTDNFINFRFLLIYNKKNVNFDCTAKRSVSGEVVFECFFDTDNDVPTEFTADDLSAHFNESFGEAVIDFFDQAELDAMSEDILTQVEANNQNFLEQFPTILEAEFARIDYIQSLKESRHESGLFETHYIVFDIPLGMATSQSGIHPVSVYGTIAVDDDPSGRLRLGQLILSVDNEVITDFENTVLSEANRSTIVEYITSLVRKHAGPDVFFDLPAEETTAGNSIGWIEFGSLNLRVSEVNVAYQATKQAFASDRLSSSGLLTDRTTLSAFKYSRSQLGTDHSLAEIEFEVTLHYQSGNPESLNCIVATDSDKNLSYNCRALSPNTSLGEEQLAMFETALAEQASAEFAEIFLIYAEM